MNEKLKDKEFFIKINLTIMQITWFYKEPVDLKKKCFENSIWDIFLQVKAILRHFFYRVDPLK